MTTGSSEGAPSGRMPPGMKRLLLRLFRVDERPEPPPGSPESLRTFRASPRFFWYSLLRWGLGQAGALFGLVVSTLGFLPIAFWADEGFEFLEFGPWTDFTRALGPLLFVLFLVQLVGSLAVLRLGYEMRWYMVSDRALRIRYGIYSVREQTMTVVNIQNMAVKRGPLQRLFGIADLEIRTASGAGSDDDEDSLSRGLLQGLDNAEELRNLLLASLRQSRDAGLGDPDDNAAGIVVEEERVVEAATTWGRDDPARPPSSRGAGDDSVLAAARQLLAECRELRAAVGRAEE
ncbi:MAG: PH domain-containing protein [Acidobacteria bacterium]|nr:PH domain-containing protein [Acidobacteriota bacterium]